MTEEYQTVIIVLSDGTLAEFTGKAVCWPGDRRSVTEIRFTEPRVLPSGYAFERMDSTPQNPKPE